MQPNSKYKTILFVFLLSLIFPGLVFAEGFIAFTGQINANDVNVRVDATVSSRVACTLEKGKLVEVISEAYDWYKIRLPKEVPSYIKKEFVECIDRVPEKCSNAKVIASKVNIRLGPGESFWILGQVDKSTIVNIIQDEGGWYKIEPVHQSYGWVNKKFVNKEIVILEKVSPEAEDRSAGTLVAAMPKESDQITVEGTVSPYGVVLWRKATHKLVTAEKKTYFLKGNRKGLNSLNYSKVKVTGKIINPQNSKYPIIEAAVIEVLN
ncbi:MAG: SH3 domain-containing protein [Candidatus Omnitrophica bacterium]|jgi:SH3-like domain-containing protein|nr:SH3 domain-containing protein [Candidatus Omnitrophota bacterium]